MRRTRLVLGLILGALVLSSCTLVPTSQAPSSIKGHVPFGLLGQTIPGTNNGRVRFITQPVYIVDTTGHLVASSRIVASPATLDSVLNELILGPTLIESSAGYSSALPKNFVIVSATLRSGVGYIDIATPLSTYSHQRQVLALGQLTLTAYTVGAVKGVEITVADRPVASLLPSGRHSLVVTRADFTTLSNP